MTHDGSNWANETDDQPSRSATDAGEHNDISESNKAGESESETVVSSLQDRPKWLEQHVVKKVVYYNSLSNLGYLFSVQILMLLVSQMSEAWK